MEHLAQFPLDEPQKVTTLRQILAVTPNDAAAQANLGLSLAENGCSYEAAFFLRKSRSSWKANENASVAKTALDSQAWWNKNWRTIAHLKQSGDREGVLDLLGDRAKYFWDLPPLLMHLGDIATESGQYSLAEHLYRRVLGLARQGLPKMNMTAFEYVSHAGLIDVLLGLGKPEDALIAFENITPNPGNAMAHEIQHIRILVANEMYNEAMEELAGLLITADKYRKGYSRKIRMEFVDTASELEPLRRRADWTALLADPEAYKR